MAMIGDISIIYTRVNNNKRKCEVGLIIQFLFVVSFAAVAWTQETSWERDWRQIVTAAQKNGKVVFPFNAGARKGGKMGVRHGIDT